MLRHVRLRFSRTSGPSRCQSRRAICSVVRTRVRRVWLIILSPEVASVNDFYGAVRVAVPQPHASDRLRRSADHSAILRRAIERNRRGVEIEIMSEVYALEWVEDRWSSADTERTDWMSSLQARTPVLMQCSVLPAVFVGFRTRTVPLRLSAMSRASFTGLLADARRADLQVRGCVSYLPALRVWTSNSPSATTASTPVPAGLTGPFTFPAETFESETLFDRGTWVVRTLDSVTADPASSDRRYSTAWRRPHPRRRHAPALGTSTGTTTTRISRPRLPHRPRRDPSPLHRKCAAAGAAVPQRRPVPAAGVLVRAGLRTDQRSCSREPGVAAGDPGTATPGRRLRFGFEQAEVATDRRSPNRPRRTSPRPGPSDR